GRPARGAADRAGGTCPPGLLRADQTSRDRLRDGPAGAAVVACPGRRLPLPPDGPVAGPPRPAEGL
ncbi:MAG: hypothetical protein AVDCRST_MAG75-801, partial [uncultured Propionibacteriaceae bacterium]